MANSWELMLKAQRMRPHNSYLRYASNDFFIIQIFVSANSPFSHSPSLPTANLVYAG